MAGLIQVVELGDYFSEYSVNSLTGLSYLELVLVISALKRFLCHFIWPVKNWNHRHYVI